MRSNRASFTAAAFSFPVTVATASNKQKEQTKNRKQDFEHGDAPGIDATDDEKAEYSLARYAVQNDHHVGFYQTWTKTILFLVNKHWLKWNQARRRYATDTDVPPWRQQPVTNIVYALYRVIAAKLTKQKPSLEVVPPSGDSDDRESASLAEACLTHWWRLLGIPAKIRRGLGWFLCTGQVFARPYWDPEAGELVPLTDLIEAPHPDRPDETIDVEVPVDEDGEPIEANEGEAFVLGADGKKYATDRQPAMVPEGELALAMEDPLCVRCNPEATSYEEAYEFFVARLWPVGKAAEFFDVDESELIGADDGDREMYADLMSSAAAGAGWINTSTDILGNVVGASQSEAIGEQVLVIEYYRKANAEFRSGRHWINCGKKKVWPKKGDDFPTGEAPLPYGFWPPLIPIQSTPIPGQPQALGLLSQVVPLNEQLNTLDGKILEHEVTMAMGGKWIVTPDDKGIKITSDPAQVIASKGMAGGKPPIQAELKTLPERIYLEREVIMSKVMLVSGQNQIDLKNKPEGVSSGRGFLVLQEMTDSALQPDLEAWEAGLEEIGRRLLVLAQKHYIEKRLVEIRGERGKWEVRSFVGSDLRDGLRVRVQVGSSFPWSKSAQWDTRLSVIQAMPDLVKNKDGSLNREDLAHFLDPGAPGLGAFESDEDPDMVEIEREHDMFEAYDPSRGQVELPQLAPWQSQPKHLEEHYRFMKRDRGRFDRWTPEAQKAFEQHMMLTAQAVDEIAQGILNANSPPAATPGTGDGEGGGGGPSLSLVKPAPSGPAAARRGDASLTHADLQSVNK